MGQAARLTQKAGAGRMRGWAAIADWPIRKAAMAASQPVIAPCRCRKYRPCP